MVFWLLYSQLFASFPKGLCDIYSAGLAWHPELLYCLSLNWKAQWHRMIVTKAARKYFCNSLYSSMHSEPRLNSWMEYLTKFSLTASLMSTHLNSSLSIVCIFYEDLHQQEPTRDKYFLVHDDPINAVLYQCGNPADWYFRCCPVFTPSVAPACGSSPPGFPHTIYICRIWCINDPHLPLQLLQDPPLIIILFHLIPVPHWLSPARTVASPAYCRHRGSVQSSLSSFHP